MGMLRKKVTSNFTRKSLSDSKAPDLDDKNFTVCVFRVEGEQVRSRSRAVEGWVELELGTVCIIIDLCILHGGRDVHLHLSHFKLCCDEKNL